MVKWFSMDATIARSTNIVMQKNTTQFFDLLYTFELKNYFSLYHDVYQRRSLTSSAMGVQARLV